MIKKYLKKMICSLLAALMVITAVPVNAIAFEMEQIGESIDAEENIVASDVEEDIFFEEFEHEAETLEATTPKTVTIDQAEERLNSLINKLDGKAFTVSGDFCTSAHEENDNVGSVVATTWFKDLIGMGTIYTSNFPTIYWSSGTEGSRTGAQCYGFACFAHWYIFGQKNTDKVISKFEAKGPLTYDTLKKACPGDVIQTNRWGTEYGHTMIFISCDSSGFKVLDANGIYYPKKEDWCEITTHTYDYNKNYQVAITGVTNYDRSLHHYDDYGYCSHCKKYYEEINANKIENIEGTVKRDGKIYVKAHPYRGVSGVNQDELEKGTYKIIGRIKNHKETTWYKISYGSSKTGWIYPEDYYTIDINNTLDFKLEMNTYSIPKGSSVWANDSSAKYNWYGKVSSSNGVSKITSVTFEILKSDGTLTTSTNKITKKPNATSYTVKTSDDTMKFSGLAVGSYILRLSATDEHGKTASTQKSFTITSGSTTTNVPVTGISLNYTAIYLDAGDSFQLKATITPSNATNKNVTWSSSNNSIATVSTSGLVEAKTSGYVMITAKSADGQKTTNCGIWVDTYKVEYDTNGGTGGPTMQFKKKGETLVLSSAIPTKGGYVFAYWSGSDGANYLPGGSYYQNKHLELTAVWKEKEKTALVTFDVGDGYISTPQMEVLVGTYITIPEEIPVYAGYSFVRWKTKEHLDSGLTSFAYHYPGGSFLVTKDIVFTAVWEEIKGYNITFDPGKGTGGPANMTTNGTEFTVPKEIPVRENWNFLFWMAQNGKSYNSGKTYTIAENLDLVAIFEPEWIPEISVENVKGKPGETVEILVTIKNNIENPDQYSFITVMEPYEDYVANLTFTPTNTGLPENGIMGKFTFDIPEDTKPGTVYTISTVFDEWLVGGFNMASSGMLELNNGSITIEEPKKEYTITFEAKGGTGGPLFARTVGTQFTVPEEIPTRENWVFLYWGGNKGIYRPGETYTISEDEELVAYWAPAWDPEIVVGDVLVNPGDTVGVPIYIYNAKEPENTTIRFSVTSDTFTRTNYEYASEIPEYGYLMTAYFKIPEDAEPGSYPVIFNLTEYNISSAYYLTEIVKIINGSITVTNQKICTVTFDQNDGWEAYIDKFEEGTSLSFEDIYFEREGYTAECLRITEDGKWGPRTYLADKNDMIYVSNDMEIKTIWRNNSVEYPTISSKEIKAKPGDTVTVQVETSFKNGFDFGEWLLQSSHGQNIELKSSYNCSGESENNIIYEFVFEIGEDVEAGKHSWSFSIVEAYTPEGELWAVKDIPITISVEKSNYGDLNGDNEVNIKDAYLARLIAAKLIKPTDEQLLLGDVDLDGKITAIDANLIRKYVVKLIDSLPIN